MMKMRWIAMCCALGGCWREDARVDGTFTPEEWAFLSTQFTLPEADRCPLGLTPGTQCDAAAVLGQALFFEPRLSGKIKIDDPFAPGLLGESGKVSCASCHDGKRFFIDTRSQPSNISSGAIHTGHNAMSVVNTSFKSAVAREQCEGDSDPTCTLVYSWTGRYTSPNGVLNLAGLGAMQSSPTIMRELICSEPGYRTAYFNVFDATPAECPGSGEHHDDQTVFDKLALAFDAYTRRLDSANAPFDKYVAGELLDDDTTSARDALSDSARRGLAVFIGKGMCVECHRGPLFSDLKFHNTGVAHVGPRLRGVDRGLAASTGEVLHEGRFLTPPLRHVAETGPYMHSGQYASLGEVIELYRRGGDAEGFAGIKDARIEPLEIDDDEARDLEAFLLALTGERIPESLTVPPPLAGAFAEVPQ